MADLVISENFTIEDIHKIREYNYEYRKNMSFEERKIDISKGSNEFLESLEELRRKKGQEGYKVWDNIIKHEHEEFKTKTGIKFNYTLINDGNAIMPKNEKNSKLLPIEKTELERVIAEFMPLESPSQINNVILAPSYVFAILTDKRIIN